MTDWIPWFKSQLQASADGFAWALSQISPGLLDQLPVEPNYLGAWTPLRHVWHVTGYERCMALPSLKQWIGEPLPPGDTWHDTDEDWTAVVDKNPTVLIASFRLVRQEQIDLLDDLAGIDWQAHRATLWGPRSLSWVITKTFQHTYEHGDTLLRMGLWWEIILAEIAKTQSKAQE